MMNKKGILGVITTGMILAFALVLIVVFGGFSFFIWLLSRNILQLIGGAMLVILILSYTNIGQFRLPQRLATTFAVIGTVLLIAPTVIGLI